jgi:hypothetical protein
VAPYNNLKVHETAGKFLIKPSQQLAKDRLIGWLKENWKHDHFVKIIPCMLKSPCTNDLLGEISEIISWNLQDRLNQVAFIGVLLDNPDICLAILKKVEAKRSMLHNKLYSSWNRRPF